MIRIIATVLCLAVAANTLAAQGLDVAFGTLRQDSANEVEVTADSLSVDQQSGVAIFTGNVVVGQGTMRLAAGEVRVVYRGDRSGIERLEADGGVTLVSGPDAAEARTARYDLGARTIVMEGDVLLTQGPSALSAERMEVDLNTGRALMTGRVKTILQTDGQ